MSLIVSAASPSIMRVALLLGLITACVVGVLVVLGVVAAPDAQACAFTAARTLRPACF